MFLAQNRTYKTIYVLIAPPSLLSVGAVIGIVIGSLALIVVLLAAVVLLVALRYRKYKSKTLGINESNPPHLDM